MKRLDIELVRKIFRSMTLMDDLFMSLFFNDQPACVEDVLDAVLPFHVTVQSAKTQQEYSNLYGRSVRFDIIAKDNNGKVYNIEIQRLKKGASPQRARYHSSILDTAMLQKGDDFTKLR